jgi:precorrin-2 dehydrogenase/sirohydrochlorin ferrochelatase
MLPITLTSGSRIGLAGAGDGFARRHALLTGAGAEPTLVAEDADLAGLRLLFVAGLERATSERLAARARAAGVLVNVEDLPEFCDFHVPATVRRGDLLLTVSTGGRAPGLARVIREWLDNRFGPEWAYRIDHLSHARAQWRGGGLAASDLLRRTRKFIEERRWL